MIGLLRLLLIVCRFMCENSDCKLEHEDRMGNGRRTVHKQRLLVLKDFLSFFYSFIVMTE